MASRVVVVRSSRDEVLARLRALRGAYVSVGVHSDAGFSEGTHMALIASVHEFGAPSVNIPERAPMRKTIAANGREYQTLLRRMGRLYVLRGVALRAMLDRLGQKVTADIRGTIQAGLSPGLSDATKERRRARLSGGRARNSVFTDTDAWTPLIDTGRLINSYDYEVHT